MGKKKKEEKVKFLKVTKTEYYLIPMLDDERTKINGWDIDQVIKDWFEVHDCNASHATRDGSLIGYSTKVIDTSFLNPEDTEFYRNKKKEEKNGKHTH